MSGIFPLRQTVTADDRREPRLVDLDDETADEVFEALSAQTTRQIFVELHESPQAASDLAKVTDTSVQNVQYHLQKLTDADLVEVVDTWYSERGTEMKVYAPTDESLVLFAGSDKGRSLRTLLKRVVGVVGVLLPASALVGWVAQHLGREPGAEVGGDGMSEYGAAGTPTGQTVGVSTNGDTGPLGTPTPDPSSTPAPDPSTGPVADAVDAAQTGVDAAAGAVTDPAVGAGLLFFLGGMSALLLVLGFVLYRT